MAVVDDLAAIRRAVTGFAFARVDSTGRPARVFIGVLETLDQMIERWDGYDDPTPDDWFRLGILVGALGNMSACKVDGSGELLPMAVIYPPDDPVGAAASDFRDAVLAFGQPAA